MADNEENLTIRIGQTGAEATGARVKEVTRSVKELQDAMTQGFTVGAKIEGSGSIFDPTTIKSASEAMGEFGTKLTFIERVLAGFAIRAIINEFKELAHTVVDLSDTYTNFQNKIKSVTDSADQANLVQHELFKLAQDTRTPIENVGTAYSRTARAVEDLGKRQSEVLTFTRTLSEAIKVGGSTAIEAKNGMIQLSQGLSLGVLKGQDLRAVIEDIPKVGQLIAKQMGVTLGELRQLGSQGKVTSQAVFDAIVNAAGEMDAAFLKLKPTIAQAWDVLKNKAIEAAGAVQPLMQSLAGGVISLANNFDTLIRTGESVALVLGSALAAKAIPALIEATQTLTVAALENPYVATAAAIVAVTAALIPFADKIRLTAGSVVTLADRWTIFKESMSSFARETVSTTSTALTNMDSGVHVVTKSIDDYNSSMAKTKATGNTWLDSVQDSIDKLTSSPGWKKFENIMMHSALNKTPEEVKAMIAEATPPNRELGAARDRAAAEFNKHQADVNSRFNAFLADNTGTRTAKPVAPPAVKGTTAADLIRELQDTLNVLGTGVLRIKDVAASAPKTFEELMAQQESNARKTVNSGIVRVDPSAPIAMQEQQRQANERARQRASVGKKTPFDQAMSDDHLLAGPEDMAIMKQLESTLDKLGKKNSATKAEVETMRDIIAQQVGIVMGKKEQAMQEAIIAKNIDDQLAEQVKFLENQQKISAELGKSEEKLRQQDAHNLSKRTGATLTSLTPFSGQQAQIKSLQEFIDNPKQIQDVLNATGNTTDTVADSITRARVQIQLLTAEMNPLAQAFSQVADTMTQGFADAIAQSIVLNKNLGEMLNSLLKVVAQQAISGLITAGIGGIANGGTGLIGLINTGAAGDVGQAAGQQAGAARLRAGSQTFASGGYTGNYGTNTPVGIVHGQEGVLNAGAMRNLGKANLDAMNAGYSPQGNGGAKVIINNNAPAVDVSASVNQSGHIEVLIQKKIAEMAPNVIASQISQSNSPVSKSLSRHIDANRRNV